MKINEYLKYDSIGLAELVCSGEVSPYSLLEVSIELNNKINPTLNAINLEMFTHAESDINNGLPSGPLKGVPFLLKDLMVSYSGIPTGCGSRLFEGWIRPYDSEILKRWRNAGLVIIGKTNTPELGANGSTEPIVNGPTHNPWKFGYSAGGSSGGSAAAVAAGIVPAAHASDGGGSIRGPASCCGLVGLKPTRGRTPLGPDAGERWSGLHSEHVVTRTVRDCALFLDITCEPEPGAPYWAPNLTGSKSFFQASQQQPKKVRIGYSEGTPLGQKAHEDCLEALNKAIFVLKDHGHDLIEAEPVHDRELLREVFATLFAAHIAHTIDTESKLINRIPSPDNLEKNNLYLLESGRKISADELLTAVDHMNSISRKFSSFFEEYDIWLTPTMAEPPPIHGHLDANTENSNQFSERLWKFNTANTIYNVSGNPAISIPLYVAPNGLPIGVMLGSKFGNEALLLSLAAQLESAISWIDRFPTALVKQLIE